MNYFKLFVLFLLFHLSSFSQEGKTDHICLFAGVNVSPYTINIEKTKFGINNGFSDYIDFGGVNYLTYMSSSEPITGQFGVDYKGRFSLALEASYFKYQTLTHLNYVLDGWIWGWTPDDPAYKTNRVNWRSLVIGLNFEDPVIQFDRSKIIYGLSFKYFIPLSKTTHSTLTYNQYDDNGEYIDFRKEVHTGPAEKVEDWSSFGMSVGLGYVYDFSPALSASLKTYLSMQNLLFFEGNIGTSQIDREMFNINFPIGIRYTFK